MTNEEILKRAIEKAEANEWKHNFWGNGIKFKDFVDYRISENRVIDIIFSHDFAKAFWGIGRTEAKGYKRVCYSPWKSNLQKMVLEEEPLKYLEKFL